MLPAATGADIVDWARAGERAGFASLGVVDRVVYHSHEPIPALAAAAAVTSRVRLTTGILADVVAFLCGPQARWITGHNLPATGGLT